jgi:hypothetical protein
MEAAKILVTIPATSCSPETSLFALRRIKTYLRSTTKQDRLSGVALLNIEQKTANYIENNHINEIMDIFAHRIIGNISFLKLQLVPYLCLLYTKQCLINHGNPLIIF